MKPLAFALSLTAIAALSGAAHAADADPLVIEAPEADISTDTSGIYVAARIAAAFNDDTRFGLTAVVTDVINGYGSSGVNGSVAIGYDFGNMFSAELEIGQGEQSVESHLLTAAPPALTGANAFGKTKITFGLVNFAARYDTGTAVNPYLSAGLGVAKVDFANHGVVLEGAIGPLGPGAVTAMNDSDTGLAWQIGGGLMLDFTDKIAFEAGYRYFRVEDISLAAVDGTVSEITLDQHQALFGVRYKF